MKTLATLLCLFLLSFDVFADSLNTSEKVINDFLSRVLGQQTTDNGQQLIVTVLDENLGQQTTDNSQQTSLLLPLAFCR